MEVRDTVEMGGASRDSAGVVAMEEGLISRGGSNLIQESLGLQRVQTSLS